MAPEAAERFRGFVARQRVTPFADEESFRLLTGFNDIFVSIALVMVLAALAWIGGQAAAWLGAALDAAASWALAEFFTRRRRMALPSLLLLAAFVGAVIAFPLALWPSGTDERTMVLKLLATGASATLAAYLHWRRFKVPITVAAGVLVSAGALTGVIAAAGAPARLTLAAVAGFGIVTFALALWWDASDPKRQTRRADVAFWLHLIAAPMIVHPAFSLLGLSNVSLFGLRSGGAASGSLFVSAALALAIYCALAVVALVVDRRALMVSSLAYLLYAMNDIFRATGALTVSLALSALIVGAGLLLLSAYWGAARRQALRIAPKAWRARLPAG